MRMTRRDKKMQQELKKNREDIKVEKIYYTEDGEKHNSYIEAYYHVAFVEAKKELSQVINIMPSECERLKKDLDRGYFEETAKDIMILKIINRNVTKDHGF